MTELVIEVRDYTDPDVVRLVAEVQQEYVTRYGSIDAAAVDPTEFRPPEGLFLLGLIDGTPVATGGWRRLSAERVEIKRMYVSAAHRRGGLARMMLGELEQRALAAGYSVAALNTGTEQPEAVALYESSGYEPVPGFGHYANAPLALFYAKSLTGSTGGDGGAF